MQHCLSSLYSDSVSSQRVPGHSQTVGKGLSFKTRKFHIPRGQHSTTDPQTLCLPLCDGDGAAFGDIEVSPTSKYSTLPLSRLQMIECIAFQIGYFHKFRCPLPKTSLISRTLQIRDWKCRGSIGDLSFECLDLVWGEVRCGGGGGVH